MASSPPPLSLASSLRGLAAGLVELLRVRLELLTVEARDEVLRLGELVVYGACAIAFLCLGLTFLAVLLTVLLWDGHRLLALTVFATLFLTLGAVAAWLARQRLREGTRLFSASLEELQRDHDRLQP